MSNLIVPNIICFQTQKQLASLNNIRVLLKTVLTDLCARNFVRAKTSLRARYVMLVTVRAICRALRSNIRSRNTNSIFTLNIWSQDTNSICRSNIRSRDRNPIFVSNIWSWDANSICRSNIQSGDMNSICRLNIQFWDTNLICRLNIRSWDTNLICRYNSIHLMRFF